MIDWKHPLVILGAGSAVGAVGWILTTFINPDRSDLRFEIQALRQGIPLAPGAPPLQSERPIFCDTVRLALVASHNQIGARPVLVHQIAVHAEPLAGFDGKSEKNRCHVDRLGGIPYGIGEANKYIITLTDKAIGGRFLKGPGKGEAFSVSPSNLLQARHETRVISLRPGEEPLSLDIIVESRTSAPRRVWFVATYDLLGEKTKSTSELLIWR